MLVEVKVKETTLVNNKPRKKTITYTSNCDFYTQAEYAVMKELEEKKLEQHEMLSLKLSSIREIDTASYDENKDSFIATLKDIYVDDSGKEKSLRYKVLLWASDLIEANKRILLLSKQGYDMLIESIKQVDYVYLGEAYQKDVTDDKDKENQD